MYTWKSPTDNPGNRVKIQIYYNILINNQYKNSFKAAKSHPGADINYDHTVMKEVNKSIRDIKASDKVIKVNTNRRKNNNY